MQIAAMNETINSRVNYPKAMQEKRPWLQVPYDAIPSMWMGYSEIQL